MAFRIRLLEGGLTNDIPRCALVGEAPSNHAIEGLISAHASLIKRRAGGVCDARGDTYFLVTGVIVRCVPIP